MDLSVPNYMDCTSMSDTQRLLQYGHTYLHRYTYTYTVTHPSEFGFKFIFGKKLTYALCLFGFKFNSNSDFEFEVWGIQHIDIFTYPGGSHDIQFIPYH